MSLVGTRPPTVDEWELYEPHHSTFLKRLFELKEGIDATAVLLQLQYSL